MASIEFYNTTPHAQSTTSSLFVCQAQVDDTEEIVDIVNKAIRNADYFRKNGCDRITPQEVLATIEKSKNPLWYVIRNFTPKNKTENTAAKTDHVVGTLLYQSENATEASIHMFACHLDFRGQEIGNMLLRDVEITAIKEQKKKLSLWCAEVPSLVNYYKKIGFIFSGTKDLYDPAYLKPEYVGKISIIKMEKTIV